MITQTHEATLLCGDAVEQLKTLPDQSVHCCVTSPPYFGLRCYGVDGQIGNEPIPEEYVANLVAVFAEVHRVLRDDGTLWLNLGDSYTGSGRGFDCDPKRNPDMCKETPNPKKHWGYGPKQLLGIPWRVAFALQSYDWRLRQDLIWHKPNPMPESVKDRCTKAHEYLFLFAKQPRYYFDSEAMKEPAVYAGQSRGGSRNRYEQNSGNLNSKKYDTRNKRSVWTVKPDTSTKAHFATFPEELITPCILAGCPEGGTVLDPFLGSGTTAIVALKHDRSCIGIDLNPKYVKIARERVESVAKTLF